MAKRSSRLRVLHDTRKNSYQIDKVFAAIICVILLSLLLNGACSLLKKGIIVCFIFFKRRGSNEKLWLLLPLLLLLSACGTAKETSSKQEIKDLKKVTLVLDYVPNTNHTGIYLAKEKAIIKRLV